MFYISVIISAAVALISFWMFKYAFGTMNVMKYMPFMHLFYFQIMIMTLIGIEFVCVGIYNPIFDDFGVTDESIALALYSVWYSILILSSTLMVSL